MDQARRTLVTTFGAALGAELAACHGQVNRATPNGGIDLDRLGRDSPALAARALPGIFNLGVLSMRDDLVWCADNDRRFPLQSVFMAPLAAAALAEVDAGRLTLSERIHVTELDLSPPPSAINQAWPTTPHNHTMDIPAIDLIALAVQKSDTTAADVIMNRIGGPGAVTGWLRGKNINDMRIDRYERELDQDIAGMESFRPAWKDEAAFFAARDAVPAPAREAAMNTFLADPRDTTTTPAALDFLYKLAGGDLISPASTSLLLRLMTATNTGLDRLKAGLPRGATLAHQTGASSTDLGFTAAVGDIGIVTLAGGHRVAIAAFLAGSTATQAQRDALFADSARLVVAAFH